MLPSCADTRPAAPAIDLGGLFETAFQGPYPHLTAWLEHLIEHHLVHRTTQR